MYDPDQLRALSAVLGTGSFEAAAAQLHVTPSAISQRIKALEERIGTPLVIRSQPATATEAGRRLHQHADEVTLLEAALRRDLGIGTEETPPVRIAVNADSLDTWFIAALSGAGEMRFALTSDDQDHSAEWLRRGEVMAAVTAHADPVRGCDSHKLGALRYLATASADFTAMYFPDGITPAALASAPALTFNHKDRLQNQWATSQGYSGPLPTHHLPSTRGFVSAARAGLGWGMNPEYLVRTDIAAGRLVALGKQPVMDVPLYWQIRRTVADPLHGLTAAVLKTARQELIQDG